MSVLLNLCSQSCLIKKWCSASIFVFWGVAIFNANVGFVTTVVFLNGVTYNDTYSMWCGYLGLSYFTKLYQLLIFVYCHSYTVTEMPFLYLSLQTSRKDSSVHSFLICWYLLMLHTSQCKEYKGVGRDLCNWKQRKSCLTVSGESVGLCRISS